MSDYPEFEKPIVEVNTKIEELKRISEINTDVDFSDEISKLEARNKKLAESIFSSLTPWQVTQLARHPRRPHTSDFIKRIFADFQELHGDRQYADDTAIIAGLARFNGIGVAVIGHQKGRDTNAKIARNFGMPRPEGYRKAQRIAKLAEQFSLPIFTLIDTPGAYPGVGAEERGQSEAIASSLYTFFNLKTPVIASVIGEGGSGGALAIGVADRVLMLEYAVYSVISPEGCASILWKDASRAEDAAQAMGITSQALQEHGLIDTVVEEPTGGAHRDYEESANRLKAAMEASLVELTRMPIDQLVSARYDRLMSYGKFESKK